MAKKDDAKGSDPREWLRKKLGDSDYAEFEAGMRKGAADLKSGKKKKAEVEGQTPCSGYCWSSCGSSFAIQSGYWSAWFNGLP